VGDRIWKLGGAGFGSGPWHGLSDEMVQLRAGTGIAIPFYIAHPRLMRLERKKIIVVEGGSRAECMRILRHENGHGIRMLPAAARRRGSNCSDQSSTAIRRLRPPRQPELLCSTSGLGMPRGTGRGTSPRLAVWMGRAPNGGKALIPVAPALEAARTTGERVKGGRSRTRSRA